MKASVAKRKAGTKGRTKTNRLIVSLGRGLATGAISIADVRARLRGAS